VKSGSPIGLRELRSCVARDGSVTRWGHGVSATFAVWESRLLVTFKTCAADSASEYPVESSDVSRRAGRLPGIEPE
jgi:hypothetical protein